MKLGVSCPRKTVAPSSLPRPTGPILPALVVACLGSVPAIRAQDAWENLEPLTVVGDREESFELPGSGMRVDAQEFVSRGYTNIAQIAAKVPGVYVRNEDGFGNFPNISLRGVDGNRSTKVTMMEDGILTAPAPYSAPNAYYAPQAGRMGGIEFLKGSSQVKYGPQTTGGVVNYLSTPFVTEEDGPRFHNRTTFGSHRTLFEHAWAGDVAENQTGKVGWLFELHGGRSDGFRNIDGSDRDTGFELLEPMLKLFWEPSTTLEQRLELKVGHTSFDANETYTGLTDAGFAANPDRRYAATRYDRFESEQWRSYLSWTAEPTEELRLESAVYLNTFRRNWDKLSAVDLSAAGSPITNVAEAMMTTEGIALLQGLGAGSITTTDAFRDHEAYGWQNRINHRFETGSVSHDLALGLRFHFDQQDGSDTKAAYSSDSSGGFNPAGTTPAAPITRQEAFATAVYVEDALTIGKLTLRPGLRYEWLDLESTSPGSATVSTDEQLLMGGLGANFLLDDHNSLYGGAYRGASPANPSGYAAGTESEESLGFELGLRHRSDGLRAELAGFFTDFDQLIAPELPGGAGSTPSLNGGSAEVWGLESIVEYDHGRATNRDFGIPVYASATFTHAEFADMNGVLAPNAGTFAGGRNGNEIPYVPQWKIASGIGLNCGPWSVNLDASYLSSTWGTGYNNDPRPVGSNPSAMDGKTDPLLVFDLSGSYHINDHWKIVGGIQNLFDERGILSRAPLGARGNAPRMIFAGFEADF